MIYYLRLNFKLYYKRKFFKIYVIFLNKKYFSLIYKKIGREINFMKNIENIENTKSYIERDIKNAKEILERMNPNQKINYHTILTKLISDWENKGIRPKILIHSCCAPCSTYTLEFLTQYADVTVLFANNNIHPKAEYEKRALVQKEFIQKFNERTRNNVGFIEDKYKPMDFYKIIKGLEKEKEGGARCTACFQMRLDIVAKKAQELGFDYFGSALTLSPHKNSQLINTLGLEIQEIFDVKYLPSDFKKNNGYKRSVDMCAEYDVYRQCYCGCVFAALDQGIDLNEINRDWRD